MNKLTTLLIILISIPAFSKAGILPDSKEQIRLSYAPLVKNSAPAVVNIYAKKRVKVVSPILADPVFRQFFGENNLGILRDKFENSLGSGVIIQQDGLIITNLHVIKGAEEIRVVLSDKREFDTKTVLIDQKTDLALLKIETASALPHLLLGNSDSLEVGDIVLAIGNPFGVGQTVTQGIVSALARTTAGISDYQFFIQTDASINPGNSGGALLDMEGKLIGINTAIYSKSGASTGIGFATPANMVQTVIDGYKSGSTRVIRPWAGIAVQKITSDIAASLGQDAPKGVLVSKIYNASSAKRSGLLVGDVITAIDGREVDNEQAFKFRIATYKIDSTVNFTVLRAGKVFEIPIKLIAPPKAENERLAKISGNNPLSGAAVTELSPAFADEFNTDSEEGIIITSVERGSTAASLGFRRGDIILKINKSEILTIDKLLAALKARAQNGWVIKLMRGGQVAEVAVRDGR